VFDEGRMAMKKKLLIFFMAFLTPLIFTPASSAKVYQYRDKNGVVHYTNIPNDPKYQPSSDFINHTPKKKAPKPIKKVKTK
jgi:hypothetical protein